MYVCMYMYMFQNCTSLEVKLGSNRFLLSLTICTFTKWRKVIFYLAQLGFLYLQESKDFM